MIFLQNIFAESADLEIRTSLSFRLFYPSTTAESGREGDDIKLGGKPLMECPLSKGLSLSHQLLPQVEPASVCVCGKYN